MMFDGLFCAFDMCAMGAGTEKYTQRRQQDQPRAPGRLRRRRRTSGPPAAMKDGPPGRRDRAGRRSPSARVTRSSSTPTRACAPATTAESLGRLRPAFDNDGTITAGNAVADLRRRRRGDRHVEGQGRALRRDRRSARSWATARWPGPTPSLLTQPSRAINQALRQGGQERERPRRCSRSTRRSPPSVWPRWPTSASPTRSSTSTAAPSPSVTRSACRAPARAHVAARAAAARRRPRRGRAVRRRRPGRRHPPQDPVPAGRGQYPLCTHRIRDREAGRSAAAGRATRRPRGGLRGRGRA